jgi:hypothetical protein
MTGLIGHYFMGFQYLVFKVTTRLLNTQSGRLSLDGLSELACGKWLINYYYYYYYYY